MAESQSITTQAVTLSGEAALALSFLRAIMPDERGTWERCVAAATDPHLEEKLDAAVREKLRLSDRLQQVKRMRSPYANKPLKRQRPGRPLWVDRKKRLIGILERRLHELQEQM